jgi:quaternary ammonium compound-resistance protein SugE
MAWAALTAAGLLEILWALALRETDGLSRLGPTMLMLATAGASLALLSHAMRTIPVGTAYAVWTGIGAVGVVVVAILRNGEDASPERLLAIGMIGGGMVLLKLATAE